MINKANSIQRVIRCYIPILEIILIYYMCIFISIYKFYIFKVQHLLESLLHAWPGMGDFYYKHELYLQKMSPLENLLIAWLQFSRYFEKTKTHLNFFTIYYILRWFWPTQTVVVLKAGVAQTGYTTVLKTMKGKWNDENDDSKYNTEVGQNRILKVISIMLPFFNNPAFDSVSFKLIPPTISYDKSQSGSC